MAEPISGRLWPGRISFVAVCGLFIFVALLPLSTLPPLWAGPDLMLVWTLVWVTRRPELVPLPVIAAVFLLADLLLQRPPGLWAGLVVILTEVLRARESGLRALPFLLDWLAVGTGVIAITLANRFILWIMLTPYAPLGLSLMQMMLSLLAYPVVAGVARFAFGLSRPAMGEVDALGRRL
jgi:rod shape-determining protein MreD